MFKPTTLPGASLLLLAASWTALALVLTGLLPGPPAELQATPTVLWHGTSVHPLVLDALNPCTTQPTTLDATVLVHAAVTSREDAVSVNIDAVFDNASTAATVDRLIPIREQYSFTSTRPPDPAQPTHVHRLDVPLTDRLSGSHLAVAMLSSIHSDGQLAVRMAQIRLVCDPLYNEPIPQ